MAAFPARPRPDRDRDRYDERGFGLSDRDVPDFTFESRVADLEAVVEAAGLDRFALLAGCPPLPDLLARYRAAGGRFLVCPICFNARELDKGDLLSNAELGGTVPMWEWIGDDPAVSFSY